MQSGDQAPFCTTDSWQLRGYNKNTYEACPTHLHVLSGAEVAVVVDSGMSGKNLEAAEASTLP